MLSFIFSYCKSNGCYKINQNPHHDSTDDFLKPFSLRCPDKPKNENCHEWDCYVKTYFFQHSVSSVMNTKLQPFYQLAQKPLLSVLRLLILHGRYVFPIGWDVQYCAKAFELEGAVSLLPTVNKAIKTQCNFVQLAGFYVNLIYCNIMQIMPGNLWLIF